MAFHRHEAGILQYSEPLLKQIEKHLLQVYAAMFIPTLRAEADRADEHLANVREKVRRMQALVEQLEARPGDRRAYQDLMTQLMPLMLNGALQQFGIRPDRLEHHLRTRNARGMNKYLGRVKKLAETLKQQAERQLADQAEGMRKDIKKWEAHYDEEFAEKILKDLRQGTPPDLEIDLKEEHFPFLGEKFKKSVKKARGEEAEIFDDIPKVKIKLRHMAEQPGLAGAWDSSRNELLVQLPQLSKYEGVLQNLHHTLTHELRHMTQTVMAKGLGIKHMRMDEDGKLIPQYQAGPGMPPRDVQNLDIVQALTRDVPELETKRREIMRRHALQSKKSVYNLDDLEFYTHLADRVLEIERALDHYPDFTPKQKKLLLGMYTGAKKVPREVLRYLEHGPGVQGASRAREWIADNDPGMGVLSQIRPQPDTFFRQLKKYKRPKWEKAVKEFTKALQPRMSPPRAEKPESFHKLWDEFLEEQYEGGKKKVPNPNPKTRDRYGDITVQYLMGQTDPAYRTEKMKIRRQFAEWRRGRLGLPARQAPQPAPAEQPKDELNLFARPPGHS